MCDGRPGPNDKKSSETSIYRALTVTSFHFSLPNIRRINAQIVGVLAFKCVKGLAPSYLSDRFVTKSTVHDCTTRNKDYLNIPAYQSAAGQRTFIQLFRERLSEKMCTRQSRKVIWEMINTCLLYTSPSPRDATLSRMPSSA